MDVCARAGRSAADVAALRLGGNALARRLARLVRVLPRQRQRRTEAARMVGHRIRRSPTPSDRGDRRRHALVRSRPHRGTRRVRDRLLRASRSERPSSGGGSRRTSRANSLIPLNRPILGIVTLMLIAAAALGSWDGIPRSLPPAGAWRGRSDVGNLLYSYAAVQGDYINDRWANLGWAAGAELSILAASTIILGIDRPLRYRLVTASRPPAGLSGSAPCHLARDHADARRVDLRTDRRPSERRTHRGRHERDNRRSDGMSCSRFPPHGRAVIGTSRQRARRIRAHQGRSPPRQREAAT